MMFWIFVISKITIASGVAIFAEVVYRRRKSPQLCYAIWLGVLGILILPPIIQLPVIGVSADTSEIAATNGALAGDIRSNLKSLTPPFDESNSKSEFSYETRPQHAQLESSTRPENIAQRAPRASKRSGLVRSDDQRPGVRPMKSRREFAQPGLGTPASSVVGVQNSTGEKSPAIVGSKPASALFNLASISPSRLLIVVWLVGAMFLLAQHLIRLNLLGRLVRLAGKAPTDLQTRLAKIAREMNVVKRPQVVVANGKFSPFLWQPLFGTARIVIPQELLKKLSADSVEAVLRHELVHFSRRDPLRRYFELLITAAWWWLPTCWLARRRLHELEELCTDAAVIQGMPEITQAYATALLDTEEYLAESNTNNNRIQTFGVPTFTDHHLLKTRIEMIINKNNRPVRKIYFQLLSFAIVAVMLPIGLISAGTFQQADSNEKSNSQSVVVTSHQDEDDEHPESKRSSTQININTGSNGKSSISVNISSTDDTVSISVSSDGATRKAKLKRKTNEDVTPVVWEVTEYENTAANTDSDDLSWLFVSMGVDAVIMKDDKEYLHPDLTVLSDLVDDADSGSLHDLFRDVRQLISVDARGKVLAIIAARDDFEASDQVELLNLLGRKEMKPRYGFRNPWPSMKATIDVLLEQGNLSDEANEIIEGMRRSDPEYRQQMNRKLQEEHAKLQAEHAKNIAEHAKQLEEHRKLMYKNRQSDYAKQLAEQANDVAEYNKLREAAELQQEKDMQSHARTLERKAEQLMRQAEQLKKQAERARKQVERKQDRN